MSLQIGSFVKGQYEVSSEGRVVGWLRVHSKQWLFQPAPWDDTSPMPPLDTLELQFIVRRLKELNNP